MSPPQSIVFIRDQLSSRSPVFPDVHMINGRRPILIAEDDEQHAYLMIKLLERAEIRARVVVVGDGESAIAYLRGDGDYSDRERHPLPGAVFLDLQLPRMSGLDVLEWLRSDDELKDLPVAVLTASRESAHVTRAFELGVTFFLVKPAAFDALVDLMVAFGDSWFDPVDGAAYPYTGDPYTGDPYTGDPISDDPISGAQGDDGAGYEDGEAKRRRSSLDGLEG